MNQNSSDEVFIDTERFSFGLPVCACGQCVESLTDQDGVVVCDPETFKRWANGDLCPKMS